MKNVVEVLGEKMRFRVISQKGDAERLEFQRSPEFPHWIRICVRLLNEQMSTVEGLDESYREIEVVFCLYSDPKTTPSNKRRRVATARAMHGVGTVEVYVPDFKTA